MGEKILYEWQFADYICRIIESEPGIVHFEQGTIGRGKDPGIMEFKRTDTPMGAANEIINLSQELAEKNVINRALASVLQRWPEERDRIGGAVEILRGENARLKACVKAADAMRFVPYGTFNEVVTNYDWVRAELDK